MAHVALEWSKGKPRPSLRLDEGATPPVAAPTGPMKDPATGRWVKGNQAVRLRQLKRRERGIATMNPATAPTWLRPFVAAGAGYVRALLAVIGERPELAALAGDVADSHTLFLGLRTLALASEEPKERAALLGEARAWAREHRSGLATLAALAGDIRLPAVDPHEALRAIAREEGRGG